MNYDSYIKKEHKLSELLKLHYDIADGTYLINYGDDYQKEAYMRRINIEYSFYIKILNMINKNVQTPSLKTQRYIISRNEIIYRYIEMLNAIAKAKIFEEFLKMI